MEHTTIKEYIQSRTCLESKIEAIEKLINDMILAIADGIDNSGINTYSMDDGQMKVMTQYRSVDEIAKGVKVLERMLQLYVNRRNGSVTVLRSRLNY